MPQPIEVEKLDNSMDVFWTRGRDSWPLGTKHPRSDIQPEDFPAWCCICRDVTAVVLSLSNSVRIGVKLPSSGPQVGHAPLAEAARLAEDVGFDSVWVSDHIVMPRKLESAYPFSDDGTVYWRPEDPWCDPLVSMAAASAVTERVEVGVAVLVASLRNPLILAKQVATIDLLSEGRVLLGVGAGWLAEEFEALNSPFETRGERLNEWISLMRDCWTGSPQKTGYRHYQMPDDILCYPTPVRDIPVLIGGMTGPAVRRAGTLGNGWIAIQDVDSIDFSALRDAWSEVERSARRANRARPERFVVRISGDVKEIAGVLGDLRELGTTDVVVDVDWLKRGSARYALNTFASALG